MCVAAFSGALATTLDQQNGVYSTASVTTIAPGTSTTPTQINELVISTVGVNALVSGMAAPSGFTLTDSISFLTNDHYGGALAYKKQTTITAETPSWSWTGASTQTSTSVATFKFS
jgi:hypothetical protein